MHLLPVSTVSLDEGETATNLAQPPGDVVALSFADSDLSALALAQARLQAKAGPTAGPAFPTLRLASLKKLRHPLSVDFYTEKTLAHARVVIVRCLGGLDYWRYGVETLSALCRARHISLVLLPGDDREDPRLAAHDTVPPALRARMDACFRAGGVDNMEALLRLVAHELLGHACAVPPPQPVAKLFVWNREQGITPIEAETPGQHASGSAPRALILAYRSAILAGETAPLEKLAAALAQQGMAVQILGLSSLKDEEVAQTLATHMAACPPDIILSTTAFSARQNEGFVLDGADCPILQATPSGSTRAAWEASGRGLAAADLAMQVALPEFDGRLSGYPISFREELEEDPALAFTRRVQTPYAEGIEALARQAAGWVRLRRTPAHARRLAIVLPDYPARGGRAGFAVGLDTPQSACAIVDLLHEAGHDTPRAFNGPALMAALTGEGAADEITIPLADYEAWLKALPDAPRAALLARWGMPADDPTCRDGAFRFPARRAGKAVIALQPDRSRGVDRKAIYHDPEERPTHAYLAFHLGLAHQSDALVHLGTHGTLEWLPGKAVALSPACWPRLALAGLPVIYPFIVDDPGEAAPAKRRIGAVALGHLTPQIGEAGLHGEATALRALVEEYATAQVLDPRRADLVAADILERAELCGLAAECGVTQDMARTETGMSDALSALDAHLCDIGEASVRTGLHVFAHAPEGHEDCSRGEREGLLCALSGRFVIPGPAGAPLRGRRDVLPTGRNLATLDPRAIPTRAAAFLGEKAAAEVLRRHLQDHGDWPRRIVMDLWASPTLRTGGEDMAHALALMGARPRWDDGSTRVTGFEIIPLPKLNRPRMDVTLRISGAFRDTFPEQIALLDQAIHAIAALDEEAEWNTLAEARRTGDALHRIFGAAWGRYGAGVSGRALDGAWQNGEDLAATYLAESQMAFGGREGHGHQGNGEMREGFSERIRTAEAFVHITDVAERDILDGDSIADSFGGFAAAARALGASPALYSLDTSRPEQPRSRTLKEDLGRIVRARLINPAWIEAQLAHGWRGGAELAQGLDALCVFAATTDEVPPHAFDAIFEAWIADAAVNSRLRAANPPAEAAIRDRLKDMRARGLWRSRLNSVAMLDEWNI
ncbi:cobaltochelatase subunit CobN [Xanthobacter sp. TB0139]|uniref:cobaltochelatase subunit CobN n=1 Tax=Xanthobacter sp. TB0139 TaxID=3459178 RepID=UPI00403966CC